MRKENFILIQKSNIQRKRELWFEQHTTMHCTRHLHLYRTFSCNVPLVNSWLKLRKAISRECNVSLSFVSDMAYTRSLLLDKKSRSKIFDIACSDFFFF